MKLRITCLRLLPAILYLLSAIHTPAVLPTFRGFSAGGNNTGGATLVMPADPNSQIRLVSLFYTQDTNNGAISFSSGTTALYQIVTNVAATSITNQINSTNGLSVGAGIVLQHGGVCYTNTVVTWNQSTNALPYGGTNVVLTTGGWGVIASPGDDVFVMSTPTAIQVGAATNALVSEAIWVANYGRPLMIQLSLPQVTNRISSASAHYDSQSN